jgi:hypothetical protein
VTFKNKLGWFLVVMFSTVNLWYAKVNYFAADLNHDKSIDCVNRGTYYKETLWNHLSFLEHAHIVIVFILSMAAIVFTSVLLIQDKNAKNLLAEAIVEKE